MSELRENIIRSLRVPREKAARMGYKNAKGALESVSGSFIGTTLNEGIKFFDRTTLNRGKNEITQGGETCDIRFTTSTGPFGEKKLGAPAISFFAERIIHFSNYNAIVDTLTDFYEVYENATGADPSIDLAAVVGDAVANPGETPGSLKLDVLFFKNNTMASLRERAAGFEDALHYMFGNADIPENPPKSSGKSPVPVDNRTPQEKDLDEIYYSPVEVFIRDLTAEAIRNWGDVDENTRKNIEVAVRRAVREGLERGNERANAINNINMACDDVLSVFTGLTRENYHEKMAQYIRTVTNKPEFVNFYKNNYTPFPTAPIPTEFIRGALEDYYAKPGNAGKKPSNFDKMTPTELRDLALASKVISDKDLLPGDHFDSIEHACRMSTKYPSHIYTAYKEIDALEAKSAAAQKEIQQQEAYWQYWVEKYGAEDFVVGGVTLSSRPVLNHELKAGSDDALRNCITKRIQALNYAINSGTYGKVAERKMRDELSALRYDLDIINGRVPDTPKTRYIKGKPYETRRPSEIYATINDQKDIIASCSSEIAAWNTYKESLGKIAPQNDAMLIMTCCNILYDLNLNKLGGEIITANDVLNRIGYDSAAGGIKYDPEYQKQALSILNNLFFLNEEERVNNAPEGGTIHQTTQMFQNFVYQIHEKYAMPTYDAEGNKHYPPGKLPMDELLQHMEELGQNPDSPFFGRTTELFEQLTVALGVVKEGYAINNFNPVKASFAKMDPKLKNISYRKMVMDHYKKEGLLPAKEVQIKEIRYILGDEYKPSPIINPPPTVDPPPENQNGIELLDYCEEVGSALSKEHRYTAATKSKVNRTSEEQAASEDAEHKLIENLQRVYRRCEQHPQMFLYLTNAVISGKNIVDAEGNIVAETSVNKNGGVQIKVVNENGEFVTFRFTADQRLMFSKFAPINGPMAMGEDGKPYFLDNGLKNYFDDIQAYNGCARKVMTILKDNPDISEEELKATCGISRAELKTWYSSLKFGADYEKGIASSIFPKGMNHGVKLAFSLLTPATFVPERDASGKVVGGRFAAQIYGVQCRNMQHYARVLSRVGAQVEKDMKAIMGSENFKMFGSLMHLRVVENQFIFAPAYKVGPKGGLEVRDNMDVKSDKVHAVPHKMEIDKVLEENPMAKIYVVEGGKPKELSGAEYSAMYSKEPVIQLESGVFIPASQVDQFVDVLAAEAKGKKRTIGVQEAGGGGKINGLAEPVEIKEGLQLDDPALINGDVPAPDVLVDPSIDGVVPETPVA